MKAILFALALLPLPACVNVEGKKTAYFAGSSSADRVGVVWLDFDVENAGGFSGQGYGGAMEVLAQGLENGILAGASRNETTRKNLPVVKQQVNEAIEQELARTQAFKYLRSASLQGVIREKKTTFMPATDRMAAFATQNSLQQTIAIRARRRVPPGSGGRWEPRLIIQPVIDLEVKCTKPDGRALTYTCFGTLPDGVSFNPGTDVRDPSLNADWVTSARQAARKIIAMYEEDMAKQRPQPSPRS